MRRSMFVIGSAIGALLAPAAASAASVVVDAQANSFYVDAATPGTGASTGLFVTNLQTIYVAANIYDLWSSGSLPRWSNANGQAATLLATGTDESGEIANTVIGGSDSNTIGGITAPIGTLLGEINGQFQVLGAEYAGPAWATGELKLYFFDNYAGDNSNQITVSAAVPEPATWALMMAGFGILGFGLRRRTAAGSRVSFKFA